MPPLTDEHTRRNVIRQWILGFPRDTIAERIGIGAGTVSSIIANYKVSLEEPDFDSIRQLAVEARRHSWNFANLASHARLYNYFIKSGAAEDKIESFITRASSNDVLLVFELVYQLHEISKEESIPLDHVSNYIKEKLEEKQKINDDIQQANAELQSKNVSVEAMNEHLKLNEKLNEYNLSFHDIDKLLNVLVNAKENGFDGKKIVAKLRKIKRLQSKEDKLKHHCEILSGQVKECNNVLPLAQKIKAMNIDIKELLVFHTVVNQIAKQYDLPPSVAAFRLFRDIRDYNKIGGLKRELSGLYLQKHALVQACARQSQSLIALAKLKSHGITEEQIISLNNFLERNQSSL
jgi:uncharacterized protein (UPF0335 family)